MRYGFAITDDRYIAMS
ncbi:hypothetical protein [Chlorobium limicola]|nr:hypothetical protein [Chlorobium limicola]